MRQLWLPLVLLAAACGGGDPPAKPGVTDDPAEIAAALAELSPEDRTIAERQATCPVSGERLGSMGVPVRMEHEGEAVFLCCDGCVRRFRSDPAGYAAAARRD